MQMRMEFDGPDGSMKLAEIGKRKGAIITSKDNGEIEQVTVMTVVKDRLLVLVEGNEFTTPDEVLALAALFDYEKLEKLLAQ